LKERRLKSFQKNPFSIFRTVKEHFVKFLIYFLNVCLSILKGAVDDFIVSNKPSGIKIAHVGVESLFSLTPKLIFMKTKTMAVSLMLTFFSCSLFAQNQTDTVPQTNPTDSVPKTDTVRTDTSSVSAFINKIKETKSVSQSNRAFTDAIVYATFPAKENEETISAK
jgi:hypothetical protein